jgi:predicted DNA-binding transcriptional regulator YafY
VSRSQRLLDLLQHLRRHRRPVGGAALAAELGISLRTLYRDIATLQAQGAAIDGAPGLGYVLKPGFTLPPLMFSADELEALVLGSRWVMDRGDARLANAARDVLAKVAAVLPAELRHELDTAALVVAPGPALAPGEHDLALVRDAIRRERKLHIHYLDAGGKATERNIWPFAIGFFDRVKVVVAWCESRQANRHFRVDRIQAMQALDERYPKRRQVLLAEWRRQEGIAEP